MSEWMTVVLSVLGGAASGIAAVWAFAEYVLKKRLDHHYARVEALFAKQLEIGNKAAEAFSAEELTIYPALSALVYKAKTSVDWMGRAKTVFDLPHADFVAAVATLTTNLHAYRIYLPKELFELIHKYKRMLQDLAVAVDIATRPDEAPADGQIPEPMQRQIERASKKIKDLCNEIVPKLRERMLALKGPLAESSEPHVVTSR